MPSENLSDGIFACKSVEDFTPADSFHTARRAVMSKLSKSFISRVRTPFPEKHRLLRAGFLPSLNVPLPLHHRLP
ncbi:hypothetical protein [Neisseria meningitidis]|uniref:hypothetical protein n=1 Tax=Neisseria meningitidis TaxID=487 RepID=UPI0038BBE246